jgi:hypothetical protein
VGECIRLIALYIRVSQALQYAVSRGDVRAVEALLKQKVDVKTFDYVPPCPPDEFYAPKTTDDSESGSGKKK